MNTNQKVGDMTALLLHCAPFDNAADTMISLGLRSESVLPIRPDPMGQHRSAWTRRAHDHGDRAVRLEGVAAGPNCRHV